MSQEQAILAQRLGNRIQQGAMTAGQALTALVEQGKMMYDHLVPIKGIDYHVEEEIPFGDEKPPSNVRMLFRDADKVVGATLHDNAVSHLADRLDLPGAYLKSLVRGDEWKMKLAAHTLNEFTGHAEGRNVLVRNVGQEARAVLSDKYRRLNNVPIFTGFLKQANERGAKLYDGHLSDLRMYMEVVDPEMFLIETSKNGQVWAAVGAQISSSDFGKGSLEVRSFWLQVKCLNGMVGQQIIREVHLGKRLSEADFAFSQRTYTLDTNTMASAVSDIAGSMFTPEYRQRVAAGVANASEEEVQLETMAKALPKLGVYEAEMEALMQLLAESNPERGVTGALTKWKVSQALTAVPEVLGSNPERTRELQVIGGNLVPLPSLN